MKTSSHAAKGSIYTTVGQVIQSGNLTWFQNHKCTKKLTEIQSLGQYFLDILLAFNWKSLHINFRQLITHNHSYKIITGNRKAVQLTMTFHYHTQISSWLSSSSILMPPYSDCNTAGSSQQMKKLDKNNWTKWIIYFQTDLEKSNETDTPSKQFGTTSLTLQVTDIV